MWLRRLVGIMIILAFIVMNTLTVYGLAFPKKEVKEAIDTSAIVLPPPTIEFTADPTKVAAGQSSSLSWTTTGSPKCVATSSIVGSPWSGEKTQNGAESTGRLTKEGNFTYTIKCTNDGGSAESTATITVGKATAPTQAITSSQKSNSSGGATYCSGLKDYPCYGSKDVAAHGGAGNCWVYSGGYVLNITSFDKAFHINKSGIKSIEISSVCGKDIGPALNGSASAGGQTRNHLQATKSSLANANTKPYIVGRYDGSK